MINVSRNKNEIDLLLNSFLNDIATCLCIVLEPLDKTVLAEPQVEVGNVYESRHLYPTWSIKWNTFIIVYPGGDD